MKNFTAFLIIIIFSVAHLFADTGEGVSDIGTLSSIQPNLSLYFHYSNPSFEVLQNQILIRIGIKNEDPVYEVNDIKLNVNSSDTTLKIMFSPSYDSNNDGLLDRIGPNGRAYIYAVSEPKVNLIDNVSFSVTIDSVNGSYTSFSLTDTVSLYFAKNFKDGSAFKFGRDQYYFKNSAHKSFSEFLRLYSYGYNAITALYKEYLSWDGNCHGMASSVGRYLISPETKLFEDLDVFQWDSSNVDVWATITDFQSNQPQVFEHAFFDIDYEYEYNELKANILHYLPTTLGLRNSEKFEAGHCVLVTNLTILKNEAKAYINVYENTQPNRFKTATYNLITNKFEYNHEYDSFIINPIPPFPEHTSTILTGFLQMFGNVLLEDDEKLVAGACPINMHIINSSGLRTGYLNDGTFIHEIPNTRVYKIPTYDAVNDSLTLIYVPKQDTYQVIINGTNAGNMRFEYYNPVSENALNLSKADSVTISASTIAVFDETSSTSTLLIDNDGDGTFDDSHNMDSSLVAISSKGNHMLPETFNLLQNYPNPFNPITTVQYEIAKLSYVSIVIYNSLGQFVKTLVKQKQNSGNYKVIWDGKDDLGNQVSSGVYFYKIQAQDYAKVKKMVLIR